MLRKSACCAALIAAVFATAASANVQVGSSGWQWGNPLPQGNTLRSMAFAGSTGYAAGEFGTLLKTTDGGGTWSGLPVGAFDDLSIVQAVDADTVVTGGGCAARRSVDGGQTFTAIAFAPVESECPARLVDMAFADADRGFLLLADGSVFTTSDGGAQFSQRTAVPGTFVTEGGAEPRTLAFQSASNGFAATSAGRIFETTDAGVSWRVVADAGRAVADITFASPTRGFAVGTAGLVLRSDDGGRTWAPKDLQVGALDFTAIRCASPELCVLSTDTGAQLVRTADAGATRGSVITPSTDPIYAAAFASPTRVVAAGAQGSTVVSDDAGATFDAIGRRLGGEYTDLRVGARPGTAFALGDAGALARTTDGGATWSRGNVPTSSGLSDVSFPTASTGYALDFDNRLFRTANGGDTWRTLNTGSTAGLWAVHAPRADVVVLVGSRGLRRSTDAGETFSQVRAPAARGARLVGLEPALSGTLFAWGGRVVLRSGDGGRSWSALRAPRGIVVAEVAFANARTGLLRDLKGRIWRTTNAGRRWTDLPVGAAPIKQMAVSSARAAYLVPYDFGPRLGGYLLRTVDGGATWQPQFVGSIRVGGIAASGRGVDYLLGGDAGLLASTTGGVAGAHSALTLATRDRTPSGPRSITVTGRLRPAGGNEQVVVSARRAGRPRWTHQTVGVASNGSFVTSWRVPMGTTTFVAQWAGDFKSAGAGSRAMAVTVGGARGGGRR
jgi:photosystem II stability/assembly factor-like uncharacterized protein